MARSRQRFSIFTYRDYRQFLREWFAATKLANPRFSYRAFAQRAGFRAPNFLQLVMQGKRNLTEKSVGQFIQGLGLNKQEGEFFRSLVFFTQATTSEERARYYERLLQSHKLTALQSIEREQYEYYTEWYHPVVRELITAPGFDGSATWLSAHLQPAITVAQAERSLHLLAELGLIAKNAESRWEQTSALITTGPEVRSLMLMAYHQKLLDVTKTLLDVVPAAQRDVSTLTLGIRTERVAQLKQMIHDFRREVLKLVTSDTAPDLVVQLNTQLVPVSKG